jgi:hypothetical protein
MDNEQIAIKINVIITVKELIILKNELENELSKIRTDFESKYSGDNYSLNLKYTEIVKKQPIIDKSTITPKILDVKPLIFNTDNINKIRDYNENYGNK